MSYQITIKKIENVTREEPGPYGVIEELFISTEGYDELSFDERKKWQPVEMQEGYARAKGGDYKKQIYGQTPKRPMTREVTATVFEQTVDDLDMAAVIKAVNRLP